MDRLNLSGDEIDYLANLLYAENDALVRNGDPTPPLLIELIEKVDEALGNG